MPNIICDLCDSDRCSSFISVNSYTIVRCNNCGLLYVNPQPSEENMSEYYETNNHWGGDVQLQTEEGSRLLYAQILSYLHPHSEVLDIGSSHGVFLGLLKKSGHTPVGIEPNLKAALYSQQKGYEVYEKPIGDFLESERFDAVVMSNVIEHTNSPSNTLKQVWRVLKSGGVLLLATPNISTVLPIFKVYKRITKKLIVSSSFLLNISQFTPPNHLFYYTPDTVIALIQKVGFTKCRLMNARPIINRSLARTAAKLAVYTLSELSYALTKGNWINSYSILGIGTKEAS